MIAPNRVVSANLRRARQLHRWTQQEAAERLRPYLASEWSVESYAQAERAAAGHRVRRFDADELHAFTRAFGFPLAFFLIPEDPAEQVGHPEAPAGGQSVYDFIEHATAVDAATHGSIAGVLDWKQLEELLARQHEAAAGGLLRELELRRVRAEELTGRRPAPAAWPTVDDDDGGEEER